MPRRPRLILPKAIIGDNNRGQTTVNTNNRGQTTVNASLQAVIEPWEVPSCLVVLA